MGKLISIELNTSDTMEAFTSISEPVPPRNFAMAM
jgi:hypothetical protein